jgi:YggT family protein
MTNPFLWLLQQIVQLIAIVVIVNAVISWLYAFDIVGRRNAFVRQIYDVTGRLVDPLLRPIRRLVPAVGGLDLSPLILIFGLQFLVYLIAWALRQAGMY